MVRYRFEIVQDTRMVDPAGHPVDDRAQALAVAKRLAIDLAEARKEYLGNGYFVRIVDEEGDEVHRESSDSAEKSG